jgi:hypothetical protein
MLSEMPEGWYAYFRHSPMSRMVGPRKSKREAERDAVENPYGLPGLPVVLERVGGDQGILGRFWDVKLKRCGECGQVVGGD